MKDIKMMKANAVLWISGNLISFGLNIQKNFWTLWMHLLNISIQASETIDERSFSKLKDRSSEKEIQVEAHIIIKLRSTKRLKHS